MAFFRRGPAGMRSVSDEYDSGALKILYNISMFFYLYILQSQKDKNFYTGTTSDLKKRVKEHNSGKNISTAPRRPLRLIFYEAYLNKKDAEAREKYLKTSMGKRVLKKQLKNFINSLKSDKITFNL